MVMRGPILGETVGSDKINVLPEPNKRNNLIRYQASSQACSAKV